MKKFEYKVIYYVNGINIDKLTKEFNELGEDGWKLVSSNHLHFFFIKEK